MIINTEIQDIFRVTVISPDGYYIPSQSRVWMYLSKHKKWAYTQTTEIVGGSTIFVIDFVNVLPEEKEEIRNFCKDTIKKECEEIHAGGNPAIRKLLTTPG